MKVKYLVVMGALALAGCSQGDAPGGPSSGVEADANATLVSLNVPGMT
jgi:hypothetical protein